MNFDVRVGPGILYKPTVAATGKSSEMVVARSNNSFEPCGFDSYLKRVDILLRIKWNKYSICSEQSQDLGNMEKYPSNALGPHGTCVSRMHL